MNRLGQLRMNSATIATAMRAVVALAETEDRDMTAEEMTSWQNQLTEFEGTDVQIKILERSADIDSQLEQVILDHNGAGRNNPGDGESRDRPTGLAAESRATQDFYARRDLRSGASVDDIRDSEPHIMAFRSFLREGPNGVTPEERQLLREVRAAQTSTTTGGGYTIPTGFRAEIEIAELDFSGVKQVCTIIPTESGNPLDWPNSDDTAKTGKILSESAVETSDAIVFGTLQLGAYKYTSNTILVPIELAQDSAINLDQMIARMLGERLGRIQADHFAVGTGSGQPNGVVTASTLGSTSASATVLLYSEILTLIHSVDPSYRRQGASFLFHDNTLKELKQLKDETNSNRPLWAPNIVDVVPSTIDGYPWAVDQAMDQIATAKKVIAFGAMKKYVIRDVLGMTLTVLRELYAANHQIGYVAIQRSDGDLVDAGTNPVKHLIMA
jgi:HK97 family phage major capsid protein